MDSFATISINSSSSSPDTASSSVPITYESGGSSNTYCVIAQRPEESVPVTYETAGSSNTYCTIAWVTIMIMEFTRIHVRNPSCHSETVVDDFHRFIRIFITRWTAQHSFFLLSSFRLYEILHDLKRLWSVLFFFSHCVLLQLYMHCTTTSLPFPKLYSILYGFALCIRANGTHVDMQAPSM